MYYILTPWDTLNDNTALGFRNDPDKVNLFTRWLVSSYLGLHTYIVMSPLVLALLIVAVVGDESADSGEHDYYKITDIWLWHVTTLRWCQAPAPPGSASLPPAACPGWPGPRPWCAPAASLPPGSLWIKRSATTSLRSSFSEWSRQRLNTFFPSSLASRFLSRSIYIHIFLI